MTLGLIAAIIIAFFSMFIPGVLLAYALLNKTELNHFEIIVIGFIFGLIAPATMTWLEAYLANYIHFFTFSATLFLVNALVLTVLGAILCYTEGVFKEWKALLSSTTSSLREATTSNNLDSVRSKLSRYTAGKEIITRHKEEENALRAKQNGEIASHTNITAEERAKMEQLHKDALEHLKENQLKEERMLLAEFEASSKPVSTTKFSAPWWVWVLLLALMLITFYTRMQSIVIAPKFFEFDPYFDMIDAHYILTYGHQLLLDPSAWPVVVGGTNHRLQPLVPYLEAYWYTLVNNLQFHHSTFSTSLMSYVGSVYPPITAALLVFIIFIILYHEYDEKIGLIGAALTAMMPVLFTTFIAGEQLVEPWGIFAIFFFVAAYMFAIRNPKDKRLAILAGIAFASNFLGAHYYTVTAGVLVLYIIAEGIIEVLRNKSLKDFYIMNIIILAVITIFYALYAPYQATLQSNLSSILGIPILIAGPLLALIFVAFIDYVPKLLQKRKMVIKEVNWKTNLAFMVVIILLCTALILATPLGKPIKSYVNLSERFTTASKPLFMTVQEYIPTGLIYDFGAEGFGAIGAGLFNIPYLVWIICALGLGLIAISVIYRKSRTGVLYIAATVPLMVAGFLEVKYLPHFGAAFIVLFCIILGEVLYLAEDKFKLVKRSEAEMGKALHFSKNVYEDHPLAAQSVLLMGLFFIFGFIAVVLVLAFILIYRYAMKQTKDQYNKTLIIICVLLAFYSFSSHMFFYGENASFIQSFSAQITYLTNSAANACTILSNNGNSLGYNTYCNTIPQYWLNAMSWISSNVGPAGPRVLAWWDYGDWINWFGRSNAVIRGDNSVAKEDYAVAAQYVLGPTPITTANGTISVSTPQTLASYMNANQTKYILMDQDLISKWGALDFLGCINVNATTMAYAIAQGKSQSPAVPYLLGTSPCEVDHDPEYALLPLSALVPSNSSQQSLNDYCQVSNTSEILIRAYLVVGESIENGTDCVSSTPTASGVLQLYNGNGTKINAAIQASNYLGVQSIDGTDYVEFLVIYTPNGPNDTITDAPSQFYESNYYKGFVLGELPGFTEVYPKNSTYGSINFINGSYPIRIYEVNNYTGGNVTVPPKPSYVHNNDTMP